MSGITSPNKSMGRLWLSFIDSSVSGSYSLHARILSMSSVISLLSDFYTSRYRKKGAERA